MLQMHRRYNMLKRDWNKILGCLSTVASIFTNTQLFCITEPGNSLWGREKIFSFWRSVENGTGRGNNWIMAATGQLMQWVIGSAKPHEVKIKQCNTLCKVQASSAKSMQSTSEMALETVLAPKYPFCGGWEWRSYSKPKLWWERRYYSKPQFKWEWRS